MTDFYFNIIINDNMIKNNTHEIRGRGEGRLIVSR